MEMTAQELMQFLVDKRDRYVKVSKTSKDLTKEQKKSFRNSIKRLDITIMTIQNHLLINAVANMKPEK